MMLDRRLSLRTLIVSAACTIGLTAGSLFAFPSMWQPLELIGRAIECFAREDKEEMSSVVASPVAAFTPGNLVIYRVGDASTALSPAATPVFLDEYTPAGVLVQSIALPTTGDGSNRRLTASGTAATEGLLTRSADGQYLVLAGYDAMVGTANIASTNSTVSNRVVGRVSVNGTFDTSTALTDAASGSSVRSATSANGSDFWVTGGTGGIRYVTLGGTTSTQLSTTATNLRGVAAVDGQIYVSAVTGAIRLATVGTGLPTTAGNTITNLPGFPISNFEPNGFVFLDLSPAVAGLDTLYVADELADRIQKYSLVAGAWASNGNIVAQDVRGLAGSANGNSVSLFATLGGATFRVVTDTSGYNATMTGTLSNLVTAPANTAFRGIALAPVQPVAPAIQVAGGPLSFGDQVVNTTSSSQSITVTNTGTADLVLGTPTFATGSQFALAADPNGTVIPPGETGTISFTFTPTSTGAKTDTATINSDAPGTAPTVALSGTGIATANLSAIPTSVNFGSVLIGGPAGNFAVTITNNGGPVQITDLPVTGPHAAEFTVTSGATLPVTLNNGESVVVDVTFTPAAEGSRDASLGLTSSPTSVLSVPLSGMGVRPPVTLIVDTLVDDINLDTCDAVTPDDCSLRGAVAVAQDGDTVTFDIGVFGAETVSAVTITLGGTEIFIDDNITINGPGADKLTISGNNTSRVFQTSASEVTISGLTITGGINSAILVDVGAVTLNGLNVTANSGTDGGGLRYIGGGTHAIYNSTLSANQAAGVGGGIYVDGGSLRLNIVNSTISGNSANDGGGMHLHTAATGEVNISSSTITGNTGTFASGVVNASGLVIVANSIIAANINALTVPDVDGTFSSLGYNLIGNPGFVPDFTATGDQVGSSSTPLDPKLGPLQNNGGTTPTHALLVDSPAIDNGRSSIGNDIDQTDQRGVSRPVDLGNVANAVGGDGSDIGAYEMLAPSAARASISGRVTDAYGFAIRGAVITVSGMDGASRAAYTNSFGYYRIAGLPVGESFVVSISARRYAFEAPVRFVNLSGDLGGLDFTASL